MKNYLLVTMVLIFTANLVQAQAPSYKNFEWDILKLGYTLPGSDTYESGGLVGGEVRLNLKDNFSIGLKGETAYFGQEINDGFDVDVSWSWAVMGDYYFDTTSAYRAFAGIGIGSSSSGDITETNDEVTVTRIPGTSSTFVVPRIGYEFGHLRLSAEYNLTFKEEAPNYFGFSAALTLWGGYKGSE